MKHLLTIALLIIGMVACDSGDDSSEPASGTDTVSGDSAVTLDTTPAEDTTPPEDTAEPLDLPGGQDTVQPMDTEQPQDTAQPEDTKPPGQLSCEGVIECIIGCEGDTDCFQDCIALGTAEAQELFWELMDCIFAECGDEPSDACMEQAQAEDGACYDELLTCYDVEPPQGGTCMDIDACTDLCEGDVLYCLNACLGEGDPEAQQMYQDLINCVLDVCVEDPTPECQASALENACADELEACQNDT